MKPVASGYTAKGLSFYITGDRTSTKGVVFIPDIFGNHPNAYQFADVLAANGFFVVMPDFFRGSPWPNQWPADFQSAEWQAFYGRITAWDDLLKDVSAAADIVRQAGCSFVGCAGMCWGAKVALKALRAKIVSCAACPHPSFLDVSDVVDANGPIAFLMSKDEAAYLDVKEVLESNSFASKNVFTRYDDLYHGFLGARGPLEKAFDFTLDDALASRIAEASNVVIKFLQQA